MQQSKIWSSGFKAAFGLSPDYMQAKGTTRLGASLIGFLMTYSTNTVLHDPPNHSQKPSGGRPRLIRRWTCLRRALRIKFSEHSIRYKQRYVRVWVGSQKRVQLLDLV